MPAEVLMPALSPTMEEGKLARWMKSEGDVVRSGDVIAEIETDKATMEVEAVDEGKLGRILVPAGTEGVKVNTPIAVILTDGEDASRAGRMDMPAKAPSAQGREGSLRSPSSGPGSGEFRGSLSPRGEGQDEGGLATSTNLAKTPSPQPSPASPPKRACLLRCRTR